MGYRELKRWPYKYFLVTAIGSQLFFTSKKELKKFLDDGGVQNQDFVVYKIWKGDI